MYISKNQLLESLKNLSNVHPFFGMSFLIFKEMKIPVDKEIEIDFSNLSGHFLDRYYKVFNSYDGYYNPFKINSKNRWTTKKYASTSLQMNNKDIYEYAFIHSVNQKWGWQKNYVELLEGFLRGKKIPIFDVCVWFYKDKKFEINTTKEDLIKFFVHQFNITDYEIEALFDDTKGKGLHAFDEFLDSKPISENDLIDILGQPDNIKIGNAIIIKSLDIQSVGPADRFKYIPSERLNIITGDNSLGKTFILDCIWWSLTGSWWQDEKITPRMNSNTSKIIYSVVNTDRQISKYSYEYNWVSNQWITSKKRKPVAGLIIYARYDGAFAIWDPARSSQEVDISDDYIPKPIFFKREDVMFGLSGDRRGNMICNGLIHDWVSWQTSQPRNQDKWDALLASLYELSPAADDPIMPGEPRKLPYGDIEYPTIATSYEDIPLIYASAGIQRAVALAYMLVWSWFKHLDNSSNIRRKPENNIVLLMDEVEAHLHPKWQRLIVPSIMEVIRRLGDMNSTQIHLATHSPMVLASAEPIFDNEYDSLFHLEQRNNKIDLKKIDFIKRGRIDLWLQSEVFDLKQPRSAPGEDIVEEAITLMASTNPDNKIIGLVNENLLLYLAQDDEFWIRWRFFAKKHGAI